MGAVEADQNSFAGRRFGAEDGILDARWVPASVPAIPALVRRFAANSRCDNALFSKNHGHMRKSWNIFFGPAFLVTVEERGAGPMLDDWDERNEVEAAGSICPVPDCGALVVSYKPPERTGHDNAKSWCEFACTRCGTDFTVPEDELIFQSVPKEWLLARVQAA